MTDHEHVTHHEHGPPGRHYRATSQHTNAPPRTRLRDARPCCHRSLLGRTHKGQLRTSKRVKGQGILRHLMGQGMLRHLMMRPHHRPPPAHPDKAVEVAQALGRRLTERKRVGERREMHIKTAATVHVQQQVAAGDAENPSPNHLCRRRQTAARTKTATTVSTLRSGRPSLHASTPPATRPFVKTATRGTWTRRPTLVGKTMPGVHIGSVPSAPGVCPLPPAFNTLNLLKVAP
jgi:hypothetical protein